MKISYALTLKKLLPLTLIAPVILGLSSCSEWKNKFSRGVDNLVGVDLKVSYIDGGQVIKTWVVKDGKVTSGKTDAGYSTGYYYFWAKDVGYVQVPIERTVIEAIKN